MTLKEREKMAVKRIKEKGNKKESKELEEVNPLNARGTINGMVRRKGTRNEAR